MNSYFLGENAYHLGAFDVCYFAILYKIQLLVNKSSFVDSLYLIHTPPKYSLPNFIFGCLEQAEIYNTHCGDLVY